MSKKVDNNELKNQKGMIKYFYPFVKKYLWAFILAPLFMLLEVYMDLKQPALMQQLIDVGIVNGDIGLIKEIGLRMILFSFIGLLGGVGCVTFSSIAAHQFGAKLRHGLYEKVQSFSFGNLDYFTTGSTITRMTNDVVQVTNATMSMLRLLIRAPLLLIGSIIYIIELSTELARILLFVIPLMVIIITIIARLAFPMFRKLQRKLDKVNNVMQENLAGVRVVKAFVRADYETKRFDSANGELKNWALKGFRTIAIFMPIISLVLNGTIVIAIYLGGRYVIFGELPMGAFMAYLQYLSRLLMALTMLAMMIIQFVRARASKDRILEVLKIEPDINDDGANKDLLVDNASVIFENVTFSYDKHGHDPVLKNVSFEAKSGETIAILGTTGSGKTSLISLIPRLYDVMEGNIFVDGKDVREYDLDNLRRSIGMSLQQAILFSGSVEENIRYGMDDATNEDVVNAAKAAQAHDFIMDMEDGYSSYIEQKGVNLSGGQKQRLAIARALLLKPKILILDDSTSAVDVGTERKIQKALDKIMKDRTSFIVAQRISTVLSADRILVLEDGKIIANGSHKELIKSSETYIDIFNSQLGTSLRGA